MTDAGLLQNLLSKYFSDTITVDETEVLCGLLNEPGSEEVVNDMLRGMFNQQLEEVYDFPVTDARIKASVTRFIKEEDMLPARREQKLRFPSRWLAAASVLLLLTAGVFFWFFNNKQTTAPLKVKEYLSADVLPGRDQAVLILADGQQIALDSVNGNILSQEGQKIINSDGRLGYQGTAIRTEYHTLSIPKGGQYSLVLSDGTRVWLNASSSLTYPTSFDGPEREVVLTGEAYFEVSKDPLRKFRVVAGVSGTEVLGTHFNINAYQDKPGIRVTLFEGSVKVNDSHETVLLAPRQQAEVGGDGPIKLKKDVDLDEVAAWKNGFFRFDDEYIEVIMKQIERWYNVTVVYEGEIKPLTFGGVVSRKENVSAILELMQLTGVVTFRIEPSVNNMAGKIVVRMK